MAIAVAVPILTMMNCLVRPVSPARRPILILEEAVEHRRKSWVHGAPNAGGSRAAPDFRSSASRVSTTFRARLRLVSAFFASAT